LTVVEPEGGQKTSSVEEEIVKSDFSMLKDSPGLKYAVAGFAGHSTTSAERAGVLNVKADWLFFVFNLSVTACLVVIVTLISVF
jgi:hypothetical protein